MKKVEIVRTTEHSGKNIQNLSVKFMLKFMDSTSRSTKYINRMSRFWDILMLMPFLYQPILVDISANLDRRVFQHYSFNTFTVLQMKCNKEKAAAESALKYPSIYESFNVSTLRRFESYNYTYVHI